jgi:hypothetical protein
MQSGTLLKGDTIIAGSVEVASGFFDRLRGLLGRKGMQPGSAMIIEHCGSVHTVGMRFPIDLIFLDKDWRIVCIRSNVRSGRPMVSGGLRARRVVESQAWGLVLDDLSIGDKLAFLPADD